jgi:hypothetical protein
MLHLNIWVSLELIKEWTGMSAQQIYEESNYKDNYK